MSMPIFDMTERELSAILFVEFPESQSLAESRAMLERLVRRNGDDILTPGTIYCAFFALRWRQTEKTPGYVLEQRQNKLHPGRFPTRYVENGADPTNPLSLKWNPKKCAAEYATPRTAEKIEDWSF